MICFDKDVSTHTQRQEQKNGKLIKQKDETQFTIQYLQEYTMHARGNTRRDNKNR